MMQVHDTSIIRKWEKFVPHPYLCPARVWTIGYGHAICDSHGNQLKEHHGEAAARSAYPRDLTLDEAEELLRTDLKPRVAALNRLLDGAPTTQNQFDAMLSLLFNIGAGETGLVGSPPTGFAGSSVLRLHKQGKTTSPIHNERDAVALYSYSQKRPDNAADAFLLFVKSNGEILNGLINRRCDERKLYLTA